MFLLKQLAFPISLLLKSFTHLKQILSDKFQKNNFLKHFLPFRKVHTFCSLGNSYLCLEFLSPWQPEPKFWAPQFFRPNETENIGLGHRWMCFVLLLLFLCEGGWVRRSSPLFWVRYILTSTHAWSGPSAWWEVRSSRCDVCTRHRVSAPAILHTCRCSCSSCVPNTTAGVKD